MIITLSVSQKQADFVKSAAEEAGKSRAQFVRESVLTASAVQLGEDPPEHVRASDAVAEAAARLKLTKPQFTRYATLTAAGVAGDVALARALKIGARARNS